MSSTLYKFLPLTIGSGLCALIYEIVWMREFRYIFGAASTATSITIAIFMGGLGLGSIFLGKRVAGHENPLRLFGLFEFIVAISSILSPFLIILAEKIYITTGGIQSFGIVVSSIIKFLLLVPIILVPTFFMGGTFPAIAKVVQSRIDLGRRKLGLFYAANTIGAVVGVFLVFFVLLEKFGNQNSLWFAGGFNLLIAGSAILLSRQFKESIVEEKLPVSFSHNDRNQQHSTLPKNYIYLAAFWVGFCFFTMEITWYRILAPLLGGTTYTMGLILAVVLVGIAAGSFGYSIHRYVVLPTAKILALTCSLEALCIMLPFALGDRIAILAALLRPVGTVGMEGYVAGWLVIAIIVVMPASWVAGYQFPLLIGLRRKGRDNIALDTSWVYAWNTTGAIAGTIVGGLILIPLLGLLGLWKFNAFLLCLLSIMSIGLSIKLEGRHIFQLLPTFITAIALLALTTEGPTAVWRHTPIGVGKVSLDYLTKNEIRHWMNLSREQLIWEKDGRETSVGLIRSTEGFAFIVNGKSDGNVKGDMGTQIMAPLIAAALHPNPKKALVIGLGTGSSSGWLGKIKQIKSVDTIEIESAMLEVAKESAPINLDVLNNKKVNIIVGDGREVLKTSKKEYDIIFSEPSNPYRSGVASLFTKEFYESVSERLAPNGYFSQWLQGYDVDSKTVKIIYNTLSDVFPVVETWVTSVNDLLFVCSMGETKYSADRLERRLEQEPFRSALLYTRSSTDLEGFLSHYVANSSLVQLIESNKKDSGIINTDDRTLVEFSFARSLGKETLFSVMDIMALAKMNQINHPKLFDGEVDWSKVARIAHFQFFLIGFKIPPIPSHDTSEQAHADALNAYLDRNYSGVLEFWKRYGKEPEYPFEFLIIAEALAEQGNPQALLYISELRKYWPITAKAIAGKFYWRVGEKQQAMQLMESVFLSLKDNPWPQTQVILNSLVLMNEIAATDKFLAKNIYKLISEHFSLYMLDFERLYTQLEIAENIDPIYLTNAYKNFEPYPPWYKEFLENRLLAYEETNDPLVQKAKDDLKYYNKYAPYRFIEYGLSH